MLIIPYDNLLTKTICIQKFSQVSKRMFSLWDLRKTIRNQAIKGIISQSPVSNPQLNRLYPQFRRLIEAKNLRLPIFP